MDWVAVQQDPILKIVMEWISTNKVQDVKHLLVDHTTMEEGMAILREWKKFMFHQGGLYHHHTLAGELEEVMQFVVPTDHRVVAINGYHRDLDIKVNRKHYPYCKTSSDDLAWQLECRRQSVAVRGVFGMKVSKPKLFYKLFWSALLWSRFMWISPASRQ